MFDDFYFPTFLPHKGPWPEWLMLLPLSEGTQKLLHLRVKSWLRSLAGDLFPRSSSLTHDADLGSVDNRGVTASRCLEARNVPMEEAVSSQPCRSRYRWTIATFRSLSGLGSVMGNDSPKTPLTLLCVGQEE